MPHDNGLFPDRAEGRAAALAFLEQYPKVTEFTFEFSHIDGRGDFATARGPFSLTAEIEGTTVTMKGKFVDTLHKRQDNTWQLHEIIWNLDHTV
jgi:ketosteroid isomerase-like protein